MRKRKKKSGAASPHTASRCKAAKNVCIQQEVNTIVQLALGREARIITLGKLLFFSTETGDAWLLDPADGLSLCLVRDGEKQPVVITETPSSFGIEWNSGYRIKGNIFMVMEHSGQMHSIMGYPIREIETAILQITNGFSQAPEIAAHADNLIKN